MTELPVAPATHEFVFFLRWLRDKYRADDQAEGWTEEQIVERIIDVVEAPYKFVNEMVEYKQEQEIRRIYDC